MTAATATAEPVYIRAWADGIEYVEHLNGVPWHDAPLPRRWHRCWAQTRGILYGPVCRCPCGATSVDGHDWVGKNERRKVTR